jgi:release factor glutamine methyltransferase
MGDLMTIKEVLQLGYKKTKSTLDSEVLLSFILKKPKEYLFTNHETCITYQEERKFKKLIIKRQTGWPVAYLTNHKEFFGLDFKVNKHVLIPRPETETMVELILSRIMYHLSCNKIPNSKFRILDIGTGSGNIIISLAQFYNLQPTTYNLKFYASDVSKKALTVAKSNARKYNLQIKFKQGSLLTPWKNQTFDVIVANLPYLLKLTHPSTKYEPKKALLAKRKGLALIEELFKQIRSYSLIRPFVDSIFLEFDPRQKTQIKKLADKYLPTFKQTVYKDLFGKPRFLLLSFSEVLLKN